MIKGTYPPRIVPFSFIQTFSVSAQTELETQIRWPTCRWTSHPYPCSIRTKHKLGTAQVSTSSGSLEATVPLGSVMLHTLYKLGERDDGCRLSPTDRKQGENLENRPLDQSERTENYRMIDRSFSRARSCSTSASMAKTVSFSTLSIIAASPTFSRSLLAYSSSA